MTSSWPMLLTVPHQTSSLIYVWFLANSTGASLQPSGTVSQLQKKFPCFTVKLGITPRFKANVALIGLILVHKFAQEYFLLFESQTNLGYNADFSQSHL